MPLFTLRATLVLTIAVLAAVIVFELSYVATGRRAAAAGLAALGAAGATLVSVPGLVGP